MPRLDLDGLLDGDPEPHLLEALVELVERDFEVLDASIEADDRDFLAASFETRQMLWKEALRARLDEMPTDFASRIAGRLDEIAGRLARAPTA